MFEKHIILDKNDWGTGGPEDVAKFCRRRGVHRPVTPQVNPKGLLTTNDHIHNLFLGVTGVPVSRTVQEWQATRTQETYSDYRVWHTLA